MSGPTPEQWAQYGEERATETAYHEAGHYVMSHLLHERPAHEAAIEFSHELEQFGVTRSKRYPFEDPRAPLHTIMVLAGPMAEVFYEGEDDYTFGHGQWDEMMLLGHPEIETVFVEQEPNFWPLFTVTHSILKEYWHVVERVAKMLVDKRKITDADTCDFLNDDTAPDLDVYDMLVKVGYTFPSPEESLGRMQELIDQYNARKE